MREWIFLLLLALAGAAVVIGCAQLSAAVAWIVGGILLALFAWLVFGEVA